MLPDELRIFLTGAAGCVGRRVTARLIEQGYRVTAMLMEGEQESYAYADHELVDCVTGDLENFDAGIIPAGSVVVHLAAHVHTVPTNEAQARRFFDINTDGTARLASAAAKVGAGGFVFISSLAVYGNRPCGDGYSESDSPLEPNTPYGQSKLQAEHRLKDILPAAGVPHVSLRPAVVYGPGDRGNFLRMIKSVQGGSFPVVAGGKSIKTTLYVDNLARTIVFFAENCGRFDGEVFNVADPEPKSMKEIAETIAKVANVELKIHNLPYGPLKLAAWAGDVLGFLARREMPISSRKLGVLTSDTVVDTKKLQAAIAGEVEFKTLQQGLSDYLSGPDSPPGR